MSQNIQQHPAVQQVLTKANYYNAQLDKELTKYPVLVNVEQRTQVPKTYLVLGGTSLLLFLHLFNALAAPVSNLIGFGLPAYLSLKALETRTQDDDVQWLTYWVVFGFFTFIESIALSVVLYYLPWYFAFKTVFILWLQLPYFKGAQVSYFSVVKPLLANISSKTGATTAPAEPAAPSSD